MQTVLQTVKTLNRLLLEEQSELMFGKKIRIITSMDFGMLIVLAKRNCFDMYNCNLKINNTELGKQCRVYAPIHVSEFIYTVHHFTCFFWRHLPLY